MKRISLLVVLLVFGLASPALADAPGNGVIRGQVINGTPGGASVASQAITLKTYLDKAPQATTATTPADAQGNFSFSGLAVGKEYSYEAVASFQGVTYASGPLTFKEGETALTTVVKVYGTTTDLASVLVMLSHMILYAQGDSVLVKEYYLFMNSANQTYIGLGEGHSGGVLHFGLPAGAANLQLTYGPTQNDIVTTGDGFWDKLPLLPGASEVGYSYTLPLVSGRLALTHGIDYPTGRFDLLVQGGGLDVTGDRLTADQPMNISGTSYTHLSADNLGTGQTLTITATTPSKSGGFSGFWLVLLGVLIAGAVFIPLYLFRWKRSPATVPAGSGNAARRQELLSELAALDDSFEEGQLDEAEYKRRRDARKAELMELLRNPGEE